MMVSPELRTHLAHTGVICKLIARKMNLPTQVQDFLLQAASLHDLGKALIPSEILNKPGALTKAEFGIVKQHTVIGHRLMVGHASETLQAAAIIALTHHERFDGEGYPNRMKGNEIPIIGRICAVADVFDALISERPYKCAWPITASINEILANSGTQFDPAVVAGFYKALPQILGLAHRLAVAA